MPAQRYYINVHLVSNKDISLEGTEAHHLLHVMRAQTGNKVEIVNGHNQLATAEVISSEKKKVILTIRELQEYPSPNHLIILCQAIPRLNRLETILEKGTELGMSSIWLFPGDRSEKKEFSANQLERMQAILIASMKQCGRLDLPTIVMKPSLINWNENDFIYPAFFGDIDPKAPGFLHAWDGGNKLSFFIGPESGFSPQEEEILKKNKVKGVKLHPNILRTDTAPLSALSLIFSKT